MGGTRDQRTANGKRKRRAGKRRRRVNISFKFLNQELM